MNSLEQILSENEEELQKSAIKYYNHFKQAFVNEPIQHIFIEQNFYPCGVIVTNKRLFLANQKNLGVTIELIVEIPLFEILSYEIKSGLITDDFVISLGKSSIIYNIPSIPKKTSFFFKNYLNNLVSMNDKIWSQIPAQEYNF